MGRKNIGKCGTDAVKSAEKKKVSKNEHLLLFTLSKSDYYLTFWSLLFISEVFGSEEIHIYKQEQLNELTSLVTSIRLSA